MTTLKIYPNPHWGMCHGTGQIAEQHPYGSTIAIEYLLCDCVIEQLPEDFDGDVDLGYN